jgi:hypothetical protein
LQGDACEKWRDAAASQQPFYTLSAALSTGDHIPREEGTVRISDCGQKPSPTRLLEMLSDRFGAFEAIANSSIKLARSAPEEELAMDVLVAEAVLEFGEDLRAARDSTTTSVRHHVTTD